MARAIRRDELAWNPQAGPQKALIDCPIYEIFYGGARGGGKTDGVLGKYGLKALVYGSAFNALFFRRELPMLDDAIARAHEIYPKVGAHWNEQKKTYFFPGGGRLRFRPLKRVQDADKYQGKNVSDTCIEEAGLYPDPAPIFRLHAVMRSTKGIPTQMVLTGNPGGPGQFWIKERFIDPAPHGFRILREKFRYEGADYERQRVFIPSRLKDNPLLLKNDPMYIANLHMVGSDALVKAWLDGDWNAVEGAFFEQWSSRMVIQPAVLPDYWTRFRSFDWGYAAPFSCGWWAVASEDWQHPDGFIIPKGALIRYREWYGKIKANVGLKLDAEQVAEGIRERTLKGERIVYGVADPSIFAQDGGPSIAERMHRLGVYWRRADNKRVGKDGHMGGWDQMRARMRGIVVSENETIPAVYCFNTCTDSVRTIPLLQHDTKRPEDLDTNTEDHAADEWRYACMSRPFAADVPQQDSGELLPIPSFNDLVKRQRQKRLNGD